jgi:hypothetical protein
VPRLLEEMKTAGVRPDVISYTTAMSACGEVGVVNLSVVHGESMEAMTRVKAVHRTGLFGARCLSSDALVWLTWRPAHMSLVVYSAHGARSATDEMTWTPY